MRRIGVEGFEFGVRATGPIDATRPVFVLVPGLGASHRYLTRLRDALAPHGTVVSIDMPGFGGMPAPRVAGGVPAVANALGRMLTGLGATRVVLVGHSMGAQWAVELAVQHPDLVSLVVALGPVVDDRHVRPAAPVFAMARDVLAEPSDANFMMLLDVLRARRPWYFEQYRRMLAYPLADRVAALTPPLLVIRGENDPVSGLAYGRMLRDRAPDGSLVIVLGNRHTVQYTAPRAVTEAILAHL